MDLYILLNRTCNLKCPYCFQRVLGARVEDRTTTEAVEDVLKYVQALPGLSHVTIMGGEACVEPALLERLLEGLRPKMIRFSLLTNGTVYLPFIKKYKDILNTLQISIDSPKELHNKNRVYYDGTGSYDDILKNIDKYMSDGIVPRLHGVIPLDCYKEAVGGIRQILADTAPTIEFAGEIEHGCRGRSNDEIKAIRAYYREMRKLPKDQRARVANLRGLRNYLGMTVCDAGTTMLTLDVLTGDIWSCHEAVGGTDKRFLMGNIKNAPEMAFEKFEEHIVRTDCGKFRHPWLPKWVIEPLKYVLPLNICWYNNEKTLGAEHLIGTADLYRGWKNLVDYLRRMTKHEIPLTELQQKKLLNRLWDEATKIRDKYNPCRECKDYCCPPHCPHLTATGCATKSLVCRASYCEKSDPNIPLIPRLRLEFIRAKAFALGCQERIPDRELL